MCGESWIYSPFTFSLWFITIKLNVASSRHLVYNEMSGSRQDVKAITVLQTFSEWHNFNHDVFVHQLNTSTVLRLNTKYCVRVCVSSDLFSEHLGTHCTLELWGKAIYKVNQDFNGRQWKKCGNFIWVNSLNYLCLIKHLGHWTTFVLNNLTSAYFKQWVE